MSPSPSDAPIDGGSATAPVTDDALQQALSTVIDPEIRKPVTELGMVESVTVDDDRPGRRDDPAHRLGLPDEGHADQGHHRGPRQGARRDRRRRHARRDERRAARRPAQQLRGGNAEREIPFAKPGSLTRVYAVASGKGGVGKSSVTVNLAASLAQSGLRVGVVDADVYGFSIPRMLGVEHRPTQVDDMILPPIAHEVKVISIGMFVPGNQPVVWRGPMLHRALQQFLGDVFWGDLDVLLLDLPPGTGDIAISVAQLIPTAEILVVTTPQQAAAEVAERAGSIALQTHQRIVGVIENMSWLELPDGSRQEIFGSGGGQAVADSLTRAIGADVPLLGQIPLDVNLREGADQGTPGRAAQPGVPGRRVAAGHRPRSRHALARAGRSLARPVPRRPLTSTTSPAPPGSMHNAGDPRRFHVDSATPGRQVASSSYGVGLAASWPPVLGA